MPSTSTTPQASVEPTTQPLPDVSPTATVADSAPTEGAPTLTPPVAPQATEPVAVGQPGAAQPSDCVDQAAYIKDVTIPDGTSFSSGESFIKTWRVRNTGTCEWGTGYALVFANGDIMNGALTNPMPLVPAGEFADISVELSAPARPGPQVGYWMFQNAASARFGTGVPSSGLLWVQINVNYFSSSSSTPDSISPQAGDCPVQRNPGYESEILALINQARAANGLGSVEQQDQLSAAALAHSTDMACNGFVDHDGSDGSTWYDRVAAQGYANAASARENIYVGDPAFGGTAQGTFEWWMNSQVHRDNILYANVSQVGIGYVYLPGSPYGGYYTLVLARP